MVGDRTENRKKLLLQVKLELSGRKKKYQLKIFHELNSSETLCTHKIYFKILKLQWKRQTGIRLYGRSAGSSL